MGMSSNSNLLISTSMDTNLASLPSFSRQCITLLRPPHWGSHGCHVINTPTYYYGGGGGGGEVCRKMVTKATGEAPSQAEAAVSSPQQDSQQPASQMLKILQHSWDKVDNKYAVTSVAAAAVLALWVSTGVISAIDRLPLIPGILEIVGIAYTAWFVYQYLIYQPKREELLDKIKATYNEITGIN